MPNAPLNSIAAARGSAQGQGIAAAFQYAVPASETKEGIEHERSYYEALGRFVQLFAEVEKVLTETLWGYAGTIQPVSKIVFAGTQSDTAATYIKACAKATGATKEACDDLDCVLQQFGVIRGARNDILHYGARFIAEGRATVSNAWKAKAQPTEFPISPRSLSEMTDDLRKIIAHLGYQHLGRQRPRGALGIHYLQEILQRSWRYKHPAQPKLQTKKGQSQPVHKRAPKQPHQPKS